LDEKVVAVVTLINDVCRHVRFNNLPNDQRALTDVERQTLIQVLETALNVLKSPMVELGLLKKATDMLKSAAKRAGEKQLDLALGSAAGIAATKLTELISSL
jgi:hypothetical protein